MTDFGVNVVKNARVVKISKKQMIRSGNEELDYSLIDSQPTIHKDQPANITNQLNFEFQDTRTQGAKGTNSNKQSTNRNKQNFDKALLTIDCPEVIKIAGIESGSMEPYWEKVGDVKYMGVICLLLVIKHPLSPYYVINLLDKKLPFTGIVEVTNVVDSSCFGGRHIVYLPKYVTHEHQLNNQSDQMIIDLFIKQLKRVYPMLDNSAILHCRVLRERFVQPIQKLNSLNRAIGYQTPVPNLYLCNTSMIHNSTLNNNAVIKNAKLLSVLLWKHKVKNVPSS